MKSCLLLPVFILAAMSSFGQVFVGNVDINKDEKIKIIEVLVAEKLSGKSVNVFVDFGQKTNFKAGNLNNDASDQRIMDPETKKEMSFRSTSVLLNYLESNHWEHYDSLIFPDKASGAFFYYFRRKL